jgi:hypothetical protein
LRLDLNPEKIKNNDVDLGPRLGRNRRMGSGLSWALNINWKHFLAVLAIVILGLGTMFFLNYQDSNWKAADDYTLGERLDSYDVTHLNEVSLGSLVYSQKFLKAKEMLGEEFGDYLVVVDISEQKEYIFDKEGELEKIYRVSTGSDSVKVEVCGDEEVEESLGVDEESDLGNEECHNEWVDRRMNPSVWKIRSKRSGDFGPTYGSRIMMMNKRVGNGWMLTQVALHGNRQENTIGIPVSLGCVYHKDADIIELYEMLEVGDYVVAIE